MPNNSIRHTTEPIRHSSVESGQSASAKVGGGVRLFGIRFHLGTDDFYIPAVLEIFCRIILLAFYSSIYVFSSIVDGQIYSNATEEAHPTFDSFNPNNSSTSPYPCLFSHNLIWFMLASIICLVVNIFFLICLAINSRKGVIWQDASRPHYVGRSPRRWVVPLLYISTFGHVTEVAILIAGTYFVASAYMDPGCLLFVNYPLFVLTGAIILEYIGLAIILVVVILLTKDKCCPKRKDGSRGIIYTLLSGLCFGKSKAHFDDVADLFDDVFPDGSFVPTDILAAFLLIYAHQEVLQSRDHRHVTYAPASGSTDDISIEEQATIRNVSRIFSRKFSELPDWQHPLKLHQFMLYSAAIYGYKMFIVESRNPWGRVKELYQHAVCCACCCCCCFTPRPQNFEEFVDQDNCCLCEMAAIKATLPFLDEDDIVYASFQNSFLETPFLVALDRLTSSVVVTVRGTLSVADVITDLVARPRDIGEAVPCYDCLDIEEQEALASMLTGYSVHSGMMEAAVYVYRQLKEKHLLEKAFSRCTDFNLVITGHSLGAGTATILAFLLRPKYPDLKCYSYGPPGGLLSADAAASSKDFCVSVIVGSDIIPRTTIKAVHNLRSHMVDVLRETQISKYNILSHGLVGSCCSSERDWLKRIEEDFQRIHERRRPSTESTLVGNEDHQSVQPIFVRSAAENYGSTEAPKEGQNHSSPAASSPTSTIEMFPPGNLIHFEMSTAESHDVVNVMLQDPSFFKDIIVTPSMIADHMPAAYVKALKTSLSHMNRMA